MTAGFCLRTADEVRRDAKAVEFLDHVGLQDRPGRTPRGRGADCVAADRRALVAACRFEGRRDPHRDRSGSTARLAANHIAIHVRPSADRRIVHTIVPSALLLGASRLRWFERHAWVMVLAGPIMFIACFVGICELCARAGLLA